MQNARSGLSYPIPSAEVATTALSSLALSAASMRARSEVSVLPE